MGAIVHKRLRDRLEGKEREGGFTLIELLIVIVVIGILAGIAILAFGPFQDSAQAACDRANERIAAGVDAATAASQELGLNLTQDDFVEGTFAELTDCEFVAGPGGPGGATFTASHEGQVIAGTGSVDISDATADNLLVAVVGTRVNAPGASDGAAATTGDIDAPSVSGWTTQGHVYIKGGGTADRRGIAVLTRVADGTEDELEVSWTGSDVVRVHEFSRDSGSWTNSGSFVGTEGSVTQSSPLTLSAASSSTDSGLYLAGLVVRDGSSISLSPTSMAGQTGGSVGLGLGWSNVTSSGTQPTVTADWAGDEGSGFTLVMR